MYLSITRGHLTCLAAGKGGSIGCSGGEKLEQDGHEILVCDHHIDHPAVCYHVGGDLTAPLGAAVFGIGQKGQAMESQDPSSDWHSRSPGQGCQ